MKTYADTCLERAEKATEGPWHTGHLSEVRFDHADIDSATGETIAEDVFGTYNRVFIAHSRTDVPELARRLKVACELLRDIEPYLHPNARGPWFNIRALVDKLEAIPKGEK